MVKQVIADIDTKTGEIISIRGDYTAKKKRVRKKNHHFYLTYYDTLTKAGKNLTAPMQAILGEMDLQNRIEVDVDLLQTLSENYQIKISTLKVSMMRMCDVGLMMRLSKNRYFANPYYFTKTSEYQIGKLRDEYSQKLFEKKDSYSKNKTRTTQREEKRIASFEKQIQDILLSN